MDGNSISAPIKTLFETAGGGSVITGLDVRGAAATAIGLGHIPVAVAAMAQSFHANIFTTHHLKIGA